LLTSNDPGNGISTFRRQCLVRMGLSRSRADLIAGMAWGTVPNG